jgi:hypothetical protein
VHLKLSNQAKWCCSGAKVHLNADDVSGNPILAVLECTLALGIRKLRIFLRLECILAPEDTIWHLTLALEDTSSLISLTVTCPTRNRAEYAGSKKSGTQRGACICMRSRRQPTLQVQRPLQRRSARSGQRIDRILGGGGLFLFVVQSHA